MIETAENLRRDTGSAARSRTSSRCARTSRAVAAHEAGSSPTRLVPVTVPGSEGRPDTVVDRDEHPRADTTVERSAALRPIRSRSTRMRRSPPAMPRGQNDGAALCVVTTRAEGRQARV